MDYIKIALPTGRIKKNAYKILKKAGLGDSIELDSRKLVFKDEKNKIEYISVKPSDVVTYVQNGVADLGIVGKDIILENDNDVYEIFDFGFGKCTFSIAGKENQTIYSKDKSLRVATGFPNITKKYFDSKQQRIEIIKLNGSVELAPLVGLSDVIVDLVETGNTLKANGLQVIEEMFPISVRLICNRISYRFKYDRIEDIVKALDEVKD